MLSDNFSKLTVYTIKKDFFFYGYAACCDIYVYSKKQYHEIQDLRNIQNGAIDLTICKTEFRENSLFENNLA